MNTQASCDPEKPEEAKENNDTDAVSALMALASSDGSSSPVVDEDKASVQTHQPSVEASPAIALTKSTDQSAMSKASSSSNRFPCKLMSILNDTENTRIVSWSPDGKSFMFHDRKAFESTVLPSTFKDSKFDSFLRKLYRWGFSKCQVHSKVGRPAYKHEKFLRDFPEECSRMECKSKPKLQMPRFNNHNVGANNFLSTHQHHHGPQQMFGDLSTNYAGYIPSSHMQSLPGTGSGRSNFLMPPDICAYDMPPNSLSEYISSRRQQHARVMNSAASLFNSRPIAPNNNNMNLDPNDSNSIQRNSSSNYVGSGIGVVGVGTNAGSHPYHESAQGFLSNPTEISLGGHTYSRGPPIVADRRIDSSVDVAVSEMQTMRMGTFKTFDHGRF